MAASLNLSSLVNSGSVPRMGLLGPRPHGRTLLFRVRDCTPICGESRRHIGLGMVEVLQSRIPWQEARAMAGMDKDTSVQDLPVWQILSNQTSCQN